MSKAIITIVTIFFLGAAGAQIHPLWAGDPVVVSPLIGDSLDAREAGIYNMFQTYPDFQWAVFFVGQDSVLMAKVAYISNGIPSLDTLQLNYSLSQVGQLMKASHEELISAGMKIPGKVVKVYLPLGETNVGELLSVRDTSLLIGSEKEIPGSERVPMLGYVKVLPARNIRGISIEGKSWTSTLMGVGFFAGFATGYLIGSSQGDDPLPSQTPPEGLGWGALFWQPPTAKTKDEKGTDAALIGGAVGIGVGFVLGSVFSTGDTTLGPAFQNDAKERDFWRNQFANDLAGKKVARYSLAELQDLIAKVHKSYTPHCSAFEDDLDVASWRTILDTPSEGSAFDIARAETAAFLLNLSSGRITQSTIVNDDLRTAGEVLAYAFIMLASERKTDHERARELVERVNEKWPIDELEVPPQSVSVMGFEPPGLSYVELQSLNESARFRFVEPESLREMR